MKPASRVVDGTRLLSTEQSTYMEQELSSLHTETGVNFYVAIFPSAGGDVFEKGQDLTRQWVGEQPGGVLVYGRGEQRASVAFSQALMEHYPTDETTIAYEAVQKAFESTVGSPQERIVASVDALKSLLVPMEQERLRRTEPLATKNRRALLVYGVSMAALASVAVLLVALTGRHLRLRRTRHLFPEVEVGQRLGAPFGGGLVVLSSGHSAMNATASGSNRH